MGAALARIRHGDYVAELDYEESTSLFRGRVTNVEGELLYFWGNSREELQAEFARSVQDHERICRASSHPLPSSSTTSLAA
jgi:predicted HicB family RNase H-like nuclease